VVVIPEYFGMGLRRPKEPCSIVIFNQNVHYMFDGLTPGASVKGSLMADDRVPTIVVSKHNEEYLRYAFPNKSIYLVPNAVDTSIFHYCADKRRQIAFMPRKLPKDLAAVLAMLESKGALEGWSLCPIDGVSERTVAERLKESSVFLSTSTVEGFGLPTLEALLCGCVVVGYTGQASSEFFDDSTGFPVPQEDRLAFARRLESVLYDLNRDARAYQDRAALVSERLAVTYSLERERQAIIAAWKVLSPEHDPDGTSTAELTRFPRSP
jgi:glycosyltransferase involved in cell wall biosynthesis